MKLLVIDSEGIGAFDEDQNHDSKIFLFTLLLSKDAIDEVLNKLKQTAHLQTIQLETKIDADLVGGYILQWEDKLIDNSIRRGLTILNAGVTIEIFILRFFVRGIKRLCPLLYLGINRLVWPD